MRSTEAGTHELSAEVAALGVFGETGVEGLEGWLDRSSVIALNPGDLLIQLGERRDSMFVVLTGELGVQLSDGTSVARLGPGECAGELSLLDGQPTCARVYATTPCRLLRIDEPTFWGLVRVSHGFAASLLGKLAGRLRANNETVLRIDELRREFERAALSDALTGVHSRRWLEQALPRLCARYSRSGAPLCVAMVDVDHFKRFNDQHGHQAGDVVLRGVAQVLRERLRPTDQVARYGGEEFVLILPGTDLVGATAACHRVLRCIRAQEFLAPDGSALPSVTVSMGIALARPKSAAAALLAEADAALYRAKEGGRDRVENA